MFNRTELSQLTGLNYEVIRSLERRKILVPRNGKYTYNQAVFARALQSIQSALDLKTISFADAFGPRAQDELDFTRIDVGVMFSQGIIFAPEGTAFAFDEYFPGSNEVFVFEGESPEVANFIKEFGGISVKGYQLVVFIGFHRIKKNIDIIAEKMGNNSTKKTTHCDQVLVG